MKDLDSERVPPAVRKADGAVPAVAENRTAPARGGTPSRAHLSDCVLAVASGSDQDAFAVLFAHFAPRLKAYFLLSGMMGAIAEELAQETMVLVWRKADRFDPRKAAASTWIFAIGRNVRADALRRVQQRPVLPAGSADEAPQSPEHDTAPSAEDLLASAQREERLRQALRDLPREQAEVLRLSYFDDRSHSEIEGALGVPLGTVKGRLRLALIRLRAALDAWKP